MGSSGEWLPFYQQTTDGDAAAAFSDGSAVTTNGSSENSLGPGNLCSTGSDSLNPKGCVSKPVRRRSRVSKKTPTTLLNANANNFRSLVQQFTGCPSSGPFSFGSKRGPVNLSFGLGDEQNQRFATFGTTAFGNNHFYSESHHQPQQLKQQEQTWQEQNHQAQFYQQQQQQQQYLVPFDHHNVNNEAAFFATSRASNNRNNNHLEIPDGFSLDDIGYNEVARDAFSSQDRNDNYFL